MIPSPYHAADLTACRKTDAQRPSSPTRHGTPHFPPAARAIHRELTPDVRFCRCPARTLLPPVCVPQRASCVWDSRGLLRCQPAGRAEWPISGNFTLCPSLRSAYDSSTAAIRSSVLPLRLHPSRSLALDRGDGNCAGEAKLNVFAASRKSGRGGVRCRARPGGGLGGGCPR